MKIKLPPCPFCGNPKPRCLGHVKALRYARVHAWAQVECVPCGARGPLGCVEHGDGTARTDQEAHALAKDRAIAGWNRRT